MTPDPSDDYLSDHFFYQSEYLSLETYLSMFDLFLFGEKVMKISRNDLRRMILESALKEQAGSSTSEDKAKEAVAAARDVINTREEKRVKSLSKKTNTAEKKKKIEDIQRAINGLIDETRLKTDRVSVNGNWSDLIDVALKEIFEHFMIENPDRKWTDLAKELNEKPTLSGLLDYLAKLKLRSGEYDSPSVERVLTAAEQASRKEQEELAAALGWNSDGSPDNPLAFLDKLSQTLTGSEEIQKFSKTPEFLKLFQSTKKESFGKSHATLIRERYWGRY